MVLRKALEQLRAALAQKLPPAQPRVILGSN